MAKFRASLNLTSTSNKRYTDEISFGGVDYANPRFSVASNHALDELNYMFKENAIKKRNGIEKIDFTSKIDKYRFVWLDVKTDKVDDSETYEPETEKTGYSLNDKLLNIWYFKNFIILNIDGVLFYSSSKDSLFQGNVTPIGEFYMVKTSSDDYVSRNYYATLRLSKNGKPLSAFESNGKLYILTGEYMYVLERLSKEITNEDDDGNKETYEEDYFSLYALTETGNPYIPTTTIGIVQNESSGFATRQTFEQPNLLTPKRKNMCVGGVDNAETATNSFRTYALDTSAKSIDSVEIANSTSLPWSNKGTYTAYGYYKQGNDSFAFPRLEQRFRCVALKATEKTVDFSSFKVVSKEGKRLEYLAYSSYNIMPPLHMVVYSDKSILVRPSNEIFAAAVDLEGGSGLAKSKAEYKDGCYYVAVIDLGTATTNAYDSTTVCSSVYNSLEKTDDGIPTESSKNKYIWTHIVPTTTDNKIKYESNHYYEILIYAKVNGTIQWGAIFISTFAGNEDFGFRTTDKVDPQDYVGNIPFKTNTTGTSTSSIYTWNYGIAYITGRLSLSSVSMDSMLLKAGEWAETHSEITLSSEYDTTLKLVGREWTTEDKEFVKTGEGWLAIYNIPFTINNGCFLVAENAIKSSSPFIYGYAQKINGVYTSIVLFESYKPSVDGDSNITITFTANGEDNNKDDINKCTFGIMYGTKGYKNRLFVSGNADSPCYDWHTADGDDSDLDYFPSDSVCKYGESGEVKGYGIVSDGKLMVVKKFNGTEPTIYYRTATYTSSTDDNGSAQTDNNGNAIYVESYPLTQTNSHIGAISNRQFTDFNGDALFVDNNGRIVGLDNEGTTYDNQRVATSRSSLIDPKIKKAKSEDNYLVSYGNELYYFADDGKCYYSNYDSSYEWFVLDFGNDIEGNTEKVTDSCYIDEELVFITNQGSVFRFNDKYADDFKRQISTDYSITEIGTKAYQITFKDSLKNLALNGYTTLLVNDSALKSYYEIDGLAKTNTKFDYYKDGFMAYVGANSDIALGFNTNALTFKKETDGYYMYEDCTNTGSFNIIPNNQFHLWTYEDSKYNKVFIRFENAELTAEEITSLGDNKRKFKVNGFDGTTSDLDYFTTYNKWVLLKRLADSPKLVHNEEKDTFYINDNGIDYVNIAEGLLCNKICIAKTTPVYAYYITSPYLATSLAYRKCLDSYTIMSDTQEVNEIYVRMATNETTLDEVMSKDITNIGSQIDYNSLDYQGVDYSRYELPHTQTLLARFYGSFICFSLFSPNANNSSLTKINYLYHYAGKTYGKN